MNKMISVIVPVYNVEAYLEECLQCIAAQTYGNIEVILVDDGSTDMSGRLCDQWCRKDARFHVIHKDNGGLSDARNVGLMAADGEVIAFVDSDDVIHPEMFRILYDGMRKSGCSICCCGVENGVVFSDAERIEDTPDLTVYSAEQAFRAVIREKDIYITVWNKLYTKEVIEGSRFPVNRCHEDEFWSWRVIDRAGEIATVGKKLYGYRQREDSIMNARYSFRRLDLLDARADRQRLFEQKYPGLVGVGKCDLRFECIRAQQFCLLYFRGPEKEKSRRKIKDVIMKYPVHPKDCRGLPTGRKFWYLLSGISFMGTCRIRNLLHFGP